MSEPTCAVWYFRHYQLYVETFDAEEAAIRWTLWCEDDDYAVVKGIQFSSGEFVERDEWPVPDAPPPAPAVQQVKPPFESSYAAEVSGVVPSWLGRQVASR